MNYGLYLSASGALSSLHRQDVIANNLANVTTVGFKPDLVEVSQRLPERLESGDSPADPQLMLEQLGGGLSVLPTHTVHTQGDLVQTGNPLDVAIQGDGFLVTAVDGAGADRFRLTRDGRLTVNAGGQLVMATSGLPILDTQNQPITLTPDQPVTIRPDGEVIQADQSVATIQLTTLEDKRALAKTGDGLFRVEGSPPAKRKAAPGALAQGSIEQSAVDPVIVLTSMMDASRSTQMNLRMMQYADNIMGQAINTFGRVA